MGRVLFLGEGEGWIELQKAERRQRGRGGEGVRAIGRGKTHPTDTAANTPISDTATPLRSNPLLFALCFHCDGTGCHATGGGGGVQGERLQAPVQGRGDEGAFRVGSNA